MTRTDRYHQYALTEADEPFRRAVRDGFRAAGLSHKQFLDALTWYRDNVRPDIDATALYASFHDFATARAWPVETLVAAQSIYEAIQQRGPEAVIATPTAEEDEATIAKANALLAKDPAAYFADDQLQELMLEALERQEASPRDAGALGPPPTDVEIEQRIGRQDMQRYERMMREEPSKYWSSPAMQAAYRDAIDRARTSPASVAPAEPAPPPAEAAPDAAAPVEPRPDAA